MKTTKTACGARCHPEPGRTFFGGGNVLVSDCIEHILSSGLSCDVLLYRMNRPAAGLTGIFCGRWSGSQGRNPQHGGCSGKNPEMIWRGKSPPFSCRSPERAQRKCRRLRFTRPCGAWPCGFSVMGRRVVCGLCRASILAGLAGIKGTLRRCGHPVPPSRLL